MTGPRIFARARWQLLVRRAGSVVFGLIALACAGLGVFRDLHSTDPTLRRFDFLFAAFFGIVAGLAWKGRREEETSIRLVSDGIEVIPAHGPVELVGWSQVRGLRLRGSRGPFEVLGAGTEILARIPAHIEGRIELLNAIVAAGVVPHRGTPLPYSAERSFALPVRLVAFAVLLASIISAIGLYRTSGTFDGALLPGGVFLLGLFEYFRTPYAIKVDPAGITLRQRGSDGGWKWESLEGAALTVLRGSRGKVALATAVRHRDGMWETIRIPGVDPVELLVAIAAFGPDRLVPSSEKGKASR